MTKRFFPFEQLGFQTFIVKNNYKKLNAISLWQSQLITVNLIIISTFIKIYPPMILFSRRNLFYTDYKWSNYTPNDPHVNGRPDETPFNKEEGNEMVYLINKLMALWDYRFTNTGNKMEKLIHDKMPVDISTQEQVQQWLKLNLKF